jgi:hypothetical protein
MEARRPQTAWAAGVEERWRQTAGAMGLEARRADGRGGGERQGRRRRAIVRSDLRGKKGCIRGLISTDVIRGIEGMSSERITVMDNILPQQTKAIFSVDISLYGGDVLDPLPLARFILV